MRKKCYDYLEKPTAKAKKELTTEEQNWCDKQIGEQKAAPKPPKK